MKRSARILNLRIIGWIEEYCWYFCGEIRDNQETRATKYNGTGVLSSARVPVHKNRFKRDNNTAYNNS